MASAIEKLRGKLNKLIQLRKKDCEIMGAQGEYIYMRKRISDGVYTVESTGIEIVRCRDCAHYADHEWITSPQYGLGSDFEHVCHFWHGKPTKVAPEGFCAWGERRDA